jgi:hypothetical protein
VVLEIINHEGLAPIANYSKTTKQTRNTLSKPVGLHKFHKLKSYLTPLSISAHNTAMKMVEHKTQDITEDEATLYDRQIRLWGLDSQKR